MRRLAGAIDVGTSRVKAVAFDAETLTLVRVYEARLTLRTGSGGKVEHNPHELMAAVRAAARRLREWGVCCAGISVFRGSVLAWERRDGKPLTMIVTWMDRRILYRKQPLRLRAASHLPLIGKALSPGSPALALKVLLEERGLLEQARKGLVLAWTLDAYIAYALSGRFIADPSSATLTGLLHPKTMRPLRIVESTLNLTGIEYPELIPHDGQLARVEGVDVGPIVADQQAAAIGLGCLNPGCMKVTMGTGVFADQVTGRPKLPSAKELLPVLMLYANGMRVYGVEGFAAGVGTAVETLVEAGLAEYEELENVDEKPPEGVVVVPSLAGLRTPYAPWIGLTVVLTKPVSRADMVSALSHGVALTAAAVALRVAGYAGDPNEVRVGGGLTRSRRIVQLLATYMGRAVQLSSDHYDSARGAAILATLAHGVRSLREVLEWRPRSVEIAPLRDARADAERWYKLLKAMATPKLRRLWVV